MSKITFGYSGKGLTKLEEIYHHELKKGLDNIIDKFVRSGSIVYGPPCHPDCKTLDHVDLCKKLNSIYITINYPPLESNGKFTYKIALANPGISRNNLFNELSDEILRQNTHFQVTMNTWG